ncbi:morph, VETF-s early transcription factor small [Choristoneura rosaceana entomopoxvirus 'L']|uniref:Morph, VETF-s early transcription factor small n=1 Tax=Choristoneura rosaceana entomopoxvirus 'L' TaxID=1293539 RepID=A0ABM9QKL3_9POXV|nr:morph, VETF-s early transcription factor small [Choristoneura rosaceana entomopoxvirus 'L']CCU56087.1 morph, VETF-s early transcription factor small [Choristoneura rosaceana entomopoxvirus 'L']
MNKDILDDLRNDNVPNNIAQILPHQLATLDFLYQNCINSKNSVLLFHKMGSGKTIISLLFSILICNIYKVIIVLPSYSILEMWKQNLYRSLILLPNKEYNLQNIEFTTRTKLNEDIILIGKTDIINEKLKNYNDYIMIIDEAHNFFGNMTGNVLSTLRINTNIIYILLTGSPITNTVSTIKDIVELLTRETFDENKYIKVGGNRVFEKSINIEGINFLNKNLKGLISYYDEERKDVPEVKYRGKKIFLCPLTLCPMSSLHEENYYEVSKNIKNDMFIKILMNVSLVALGSISNYENFSQFMETDKKIFDNFYISNGKFTGSELIDLNISSKLKKFRDTIFTEKNVGKRFIYFANSTIGSAIIRSVMIANGISEYGKEIVNNFACVNCIKDNKCSHGECIPMRFVIITSKELNKGNSNYINNILSIFNEDINDDGNNIMFLFGSKIISEAYTLKNVKDIWFLTVPETKSELDQCIARAVRSFSYKDTNTKVVIRICIASTKNTLSNDVSKTIEQYKDVNISDLHKNTLLNKIELLLTESSYTLSYDFRKQLYSELKFEKSKVADNIFKNLTTVSSETIEPHVLECFVLEKIRRYCYYNTRFKLIDLISNIMKNINSKYINIVKEYTNKAIESSFVIENNVFGNCYLTYFKNDIVTVPITLEYNNHLLSVRL